jgi:hypothetical protein
MSGGPQRAAPRLQDGSSAPNHGRKEAKSIMGIFHVRKIENGSQPCVKIIGDFGEPQLSMFRPSLNTLQMISAVSRLLRAMRSMDLGRPGASIIPV